MDWVLAPGHSEGCRCGTCHEISSLRDLLASAVKIANEAAEEWDKAPSGMRAGKILLALAGHRKGYRPDTDAIHAALKATGTAGERPNR